MCCHEMNHLHAIIRYHFFDFDVCVVIFNVSYIESFYEKYSMFGKSKILCMSFSVIETYDRIIYIDFQFSTCTSKSLHVPGQIT